MDFELQNDVEEVKARGCSLHPMVLPSSVKPYYHEDGIAIFHGDCREILPLLTGNLVMTDPPYGVGLKYDSFEDTKENVGALVATVLPMMRAAAPVVMLTPGIKNAWLYPQPDWMLGLFFSSGAATTPWGFNMWQPVLAYGKDPYLSKGKGSRPDAFWKSETMEKHDHPCAKPIGQWTWLLNRGSANEGDVILDPFMGSGTTLRAAKDIGRQAIGIDVSERYCEVAARRMAQGVLWRQNAELSDSRREKP